MSVIPGLRLQATPVVSAGCTLLIAVKARSAGKSRLSPMLMPAGRAQLVRRMLDHVLHAARAAESVQHIVVVSPERDTIPGDIPVLADTGHDLNEAISAAHRALLSFGAEELVILPADLPLLTPQDIDALVMAGRARGTALAPDTAGVGTNGIYLKQAPDFEFHFGADSLQRHLDVAARQGRAVATVYRPGLALDVDGPSDLDRFQQRRRETSCQA